MTMMLLVPLLVLLATGSLAWHPACRSTLLSTTVTPKRSLVQTQVTPRDQSSATASLLPRRIPDFTPPSKSRRRPADETSEQPPSDRRRPKRQRGRSEPTRRRDYSRSKQAMQLPESIPRLSDLLNHLPVTDGATVVAASANGTHGSSIHARGGKPQACHNNHWWGRPETTAGESDKARPNAEPWQADYQTSWKTQQHIKRAAAAAAEGPYVDGTAAVLSTFLSTSPNRCNAANLVCALTSSAKLLLPHETLSDRALQLFFETTQVLDRMLDMRLLTARQLCNAAWAMAKHYERDPRVLPPPQARAALSSDRVFGVAETWDLTLVGASAPARCADRVVDRLAQQLRDCLDRDAFAAKEGELGMACWAYGVLRPRQRPPGWKHGPQVAAVDCEQPVPRQQLRRDAADVVKFERWTTSVPDEDEECAEGEDAMATDALFDKVAQVLVNPTRERSNTNGEHSGSSRIHTCQWKELANVAWAFANHGRFRSSESQELLLAIAQETADRLEQGGAWAQQVLSRDLSQIVWSLGVLQVDNFRLADGLVRVVDALVESTGVATGKNSRPFQAWSCADIVQVVLSLAHARIDEPDLLRQLYEETAWRLERDETSSNGEMPSRTRFQTREVTILLWSQARLYLKEPQGRVFEMFAPLAASALFKRSRGYNRLSDIGLGGQEQANIVWSLTLLEAYHDTTSVRLIRDIFREACRSCQEAGVIHLEHAHQLWQALYLLEGECPEAVAEVPQWFTEYLRNKWRAEKARPKVSSARHRALSQALTSMGVVHKNEHDEDIDVAIVLKPNAAWSHESLGREFVDAGMTDGVRLAVEFDGPNHFTRQRLTERSTPAEAPRALGHTVLKYRLLKKQGWIVVRVPYYEFDKIPFWASMERQRYLQRLLKTHGNLRFSEVDVSEYKPPVANRQSRFD